MSDRRAPDALAPDGSEIYLLGTHAERASLVEVVLRPGGVSRPVRHRSVEEIWHFVAGAGEVWMSGATVAVEAGSTLVIPTDMAFQFRCTGSEPLRFLCFTSPPWPGNDEAEPVESGGLGPPTV